MKVRAYTGAFPEDQKFRGQARLIVDALEANHPATVAELANAIKPQLQTRQDPERVVAFYMSIWKKKAWVTFSEIDRPTSSGDPAAPQTVHQEAGAVPADVAQEVNLETAVETAHASPTLPDLTGKKLSEAVVEVMKLEEKLTNTSLIDAEKVTLVLNENGYDFKVNQVNSALSNLVKKGAVKHRDGVGYELVEATA